MNPYNKKLLGLKRTVTPPPARNTSPLSQISGINALFDVDATLSASYPGTGQTWANLITSPADGSAQTAYDFCRGASTSASTDDPTFNGTANDPAAYWSFDGGDFFNLIGANTAILSGLHKTSGAGSGPFTLVVACLMPSTTNYRWAGNYGGGSNNGFTNLSSTAKMFNVQYTTGGAANTSDSVHALANNTPYIMATATDFTGTNTNFAANARTFTSVTTAKNTNTAAGGGKFGIGCGGGSYIPVSLGTVLYGCYAFSKILTDTDLSNVIDVLNSRHNRTYA